jgi:molecular chaperone GrpE (heat shock protein)
MHVRYLGQPVALWVTDTMPASVFSFTGVSRALAEVQQQHPHHQNQPQQQDMAAQLEQALQAQELQHAQALQAQAAAHAQALAAAHAEIERLKKQLKKPDGSA